MQQYNVHPFPTSNNTPHHISLLLLHDINKTSQCLSTTPSPLTGILRNLASYYYKEPTLLFLVRTAQGLAHMGKGLIGLSPYHTDKQLLSGEQGGGGPPWGGGLQGAEGTLSMMCSMRCSLNVQCE